MDFPFGFGGFGILAVVWFALVVLFWGLILVGLFYGVRWLMRAERNSRNHPPAPPAGWQPPESTGLHAGHGTGPRSDDPLDVLRVRYARGEIDEEEYERRRQTLTGG